MEGAGQCKAQAEPATLGVVVEGCVAGKEPWERGNGASGLLGSWRVSRLLKDNIGSGASLGECARQLGAFEVLQ